MNKFEKGDLVVLKNPDSITGGQIARELGQKQYYAVTSTRREWVRLNGMSWGWDGSLFEHYIVPVTLDDELFEL